MPRSLLPLPSSPVPSAGPAEPLGSRRRSWLLLAALLASPVLAGPGVAAAGAAAGPIVTGPVCRADQYGAHHDGHSDDTAAIQRALDACADTGGQAELTSGTYASGPLTLHSRETLEVLPTATLLGSADPARYARTPGATGNAGAPLALITASHAQDVGLGGGGTIDGQGAGWWAQVRAAQQADQPEPARPRLIVLDHVQNVTVQHLTLRNSPSFHLVPSHAQQVVVRDLTIQAPADSPNTDGIDPSDTRDLLIEDSTIDVGDDNIAIKAGQPDPDHPGAASADITIQDCHFLHGHGLSVGSETVGGVRHVVARRLSFQGTTTALRVKTLRGQGGPVQDLSFSQITLDGVGTALSLASYYPKIPASDAAQPLTATTPQLTDIRIGDLSGTATRAVGDIVGLPEQPARQIVLSGVQVTAPLGLRVRHAQVSLQNAAFRVRQAPALDPQNGAQISGALDLTP